MRGPPTLAHGRVVFAFSAARSILSSAAAHLVFGRPGTAFRFLWAYAPFFIALLNVMGLTFLFAGVAGFVALWHNFD